MTLLQQDQRRSIPHILWEKQNASTQISSHDNGKQTGHQTTRMGGITYYIKSIHGHLYTKSEWVWSGNTTIKNCRQTRDNVKKSHTTITRHQEDKQSKATCSVFPIEMIAKLEWTQSNAQQNIEQLQNPSMGVTNKSKSTTTEPPPKNVQQSKLLGVLKCILLVPNFHPTNLGLLYWFFLKNKHKTVWNLISKDE